jgi:hypothetical protein
MKLEDFSALVWVHGATTALNPRFKYFQGKRRIPAPLTVRRHAAPCLPSGWVSRVLPNQERTLTQRKPFLRPVGDCRLESGVAYRDISSGRYDPAQMYSLPIPQLDAVLEIAADVVQVRVGKLHKQAVELVIQSRGIFPIAAALGAQLL